MSHQLQQLDPAQVELVQSRVAINFDVVEEYAQEMREGANFPPIRVRHDGSKYWCWDGCHRIHAARQAGKTTIAAFVEPGARRDAVLDSTGANPDYGLRRSNDDKRRVVRILLEDEEWSQWSDHKVAQQCKVSQPFVSRMRRELSENVFRYDSQNLGDEEQALSGNVSRYDQERKTERNGTVYTMDTAGIAQANHQRAAFDPSAPSAVRIERALDFLPAASRTLARTVLSRYVANYGNDRLNAVLEELHTGMHDSVQKAIAAATRRALTGGQSHYDQETRPEQMTQASLTLFIFKIYRDTFLYYVSLFCQVKQVRLESDYF